jgi:tetratricopeptide (TPR) repeat protein
MSDPDIQKNTLKRAYLIQGQEGFESKDFEKAMKAFIRTTEIAEMVNYIDTAAYFNAAVAANNEKNSEVAVKYYKKAAELNYEGSKTYAYMAKAMANTADSVNIAKVLQDGIEKFPKSNQTLIDELIDYYLRTNKTDEAMEYLDVAIKKDPSKHIYHYVKGTLYDKQGKIEEARVAYEKTSELKPEFYAAQFNIGVLYYNKGRNYLLEAQNVPPTGAANQKKYDELIKNANVEIEKSLPFFEKAYSIAPDDQGTMQALKEVYYKLKKMDKYNEIKAKLEK